MHNVYPLIKKSNFPIIYRGSLKTLQVNLGYKCNQSCLHCHVNAGPKRKEMMLKTTMDDVLNFIDEFNITTIDLTGGAPELNSDFEYLVSQARMRKCHVIDRCNLTILLEPNKQHLFEFFYDNQVEIIASLPCYEEKNVDSQRGKNVFSKSIESLKRLNRLGYGFSENHKLNLVYNPLGPYLPSSQKILEKQYKLKLKINHGVVFNNLYTLTNMPILRFGSTLISNNRFNEYMKLLKDNFNNESVEKLMCKSLISVDYQGYVYDCDFNQMLGINMSNIQKKHITQYGKINSCRKINTADHCYACTAGSGSSCGGSLT